MGFRCPDGHGANCAQAKRDAEDGARLAQEHGGQRRRYIGELVYGGLDGVVTTFAVVSGVEGASLGAGIVLMLGLATLVAFIVTGAVPLLVFLVGLAVPLPSSLQFPLTIALTAIALFTLGALRVLVTERNWLRSGLEMLAVGGLAAAVAYAVGYLLRGLTA